METEENLQESIRHPKWQDVDDKLWSDYRWQLKNRIHTIKELSEIIQLSPSELKAIETTNIFRIDITPYFASLLHPTDPLCPIRRQVIPTDKELVAFGPKKRMQQVRKKIIR